MKKVQWLADEMGKNSRLVDEMEDEPVASRREKLRWLADKMEEKPVASRRDGGRTGG